MLIKGEQKYFFSSVFFHIIILSIVIFSYEFSAPPATLQNTNKQDIINVVILGDTEKSKILPKPVKTEINTENPALAKPAVEEKKKEEAIALKTIEKKKVLEEQQKKQAKQQQELFAKDLLADINKQNKAKQKKLQTHFEKTLQQQAEKTLRQQLLDEDIHLQSSESHQAQGEINKYKALILQAISEKWIVPAGVNKRLYCYLKIHVAPGGKVLDVQIIKTSGDRVLDNSARAAVLKASPLPVPHEPRAFAPFREFVLKVKPENILALR